MTGWRLAMTTREQGTRTEAATRIDVRQVARDNNPELAARYELYKDQIGLTHEQADLLSSELPLAEFYDAACADAEVRFDEAAFRLAVNGDMATTTKMAEGINAFIAETAKLEAAINAKL